MAHQGYFCRQGTLVTSIPSTSGSSRSQNIPSFHQHKRARLTRSQRQVLAAAAQQDEASCCLDICFGASAGGIHSQDGSCLLMQEAYDLNESVDTVRQRLINAAGAGKSFTSPGWLTQLGRLWGGKSVSRDQLLACVTLSVAKYASNNLFRAAASCKARCNLSRCLYT